MSVIEHREFPSAHLAPRIVSVWLPESYEADTEAYAVLYMHDGQNLFNASEAAFGSTWEVPTTMTKLLKEGRIRKTIVVGVWNTPARFREYLPASVVERLDSSVTEKLLAQDVYGGTTLSEAYVRFLTEELKPFIDSKYRTRPETASTFVMGSSMGGLVSWFALASRPDIFGAAGCLSTHWPLTIDDSVLTAEDGVWRDAVSDAHRRALTETLPPSDGQRRLWFDHGNEHLDAHYAPYQAVADVVLAEKGYVQNRDVVSREYPGTGHNEEAWAARLADPLVFLLGESSS